jgi:hypothetical protein
LFSGVLIQRIKEKYYELKKHDEVEGGACHEAEALLAAGKSKIDFPAARFFLPLDKWRPYRC